MFLLLGLKQSFSRAANAIRNARVTFMDALGYFLSELEYLDLNWLEIHLLSWV